MIETGTALLDEFGEQTVVFESTFTSRPTIYVTPGGDGITDPGNSMIPSYNVNCFITNLSFSTGAWTFKINAEPLDPSITLPQTEAQKIAHGTYTSIRVSWRAIGQTVAT